MTAARRRLRESTSRGYIVTPPRRLLLDTHSWIWWVEGSKRLGPVARKAITGAAEVRVSAASAWEIAIKISRGRFEFPRDVAIIDELERDGFQPLPVDFVHTEAVRRLPRGHGDPFDRMLVAQAQIEGLTIVTVDPHFRRYDVPLLDASA
jgi:PIN domain nuclease of toxin-antitoxin system